MYIHRKIANKFEDLRKGFPVIVLTGARQSGKTTFLKEYLPNYNYFNLELISTREQIKADPLGFLERYPSKIIVDEVQRYPELLSYLQVHVDKHQVMGELFFSGSQNILLSENVSQSLAGRAAYQELHPLSFQELHTAKFLADSSYTNMLKGGYPAIYERDVSPQIYFQQYIATYLERDVRQLRAIENLSQFQRFMQLLAGRVGQVVNMSSLANDVGISPNTVEAWLSILEASYIIYRLQPFYKNKNKRIIKSPKIYFYDTGLVCNLLNIDSEDELEAHYAAGSIFENFIINDIKKQIAYATTSDDLYYYRDNNGNEVDLIIDQGVRWVPIEIKLSSTFSSHFLKGIKFWKQYFDKQSSGYIIYSGESTGWQLQNTWLLNWRDSQQILHN